MKANSNDVGTRRVQAGLNVGANVIGNVDMRHRKIERRHQRVKTIKRRGFHSIDLEAKVDFTRRDVQKSGDARFQ